LRRKVLDSLWHLLRCLGDTVGNVDNQTHGNGVRKDIMMEITAMAEVTGMVEIPQ
jgi:hypothetical protein